MKLIIGGCRGTSPVAQPEFMKYGGDTTSFLIEGAAGARVVVDAGTGVRWIGRRLDADPRNHSLLMLFTHYHLDHVAGLPSLQPIYSPRWSIEMASPNHGAFSVREVIPRVMHKPFWPLQVEDLESRIRFTTLRGSVSASPLVYGGLHISWCGVHHPDGCTAYRFDEPATGDSCVIATDIEWGESSDAERAQLFRLCREPSPAKLLLMDGHYDASEYPKFRGWGHSAWQEVERVAREAGVARALVTHHAPSRTDAELDAIEKRLLKNNPGLKRGSPVFGLARANQELTTGAP